jgi:uncharacterized phage protein (TIGR01671 family)
MRSIKFRGLRADGKGWVYGYYVRNVFGDHIIVAQDYYSDGSVKSTEAFLVLPESVGQWTGKQDRDGKDIYEGDIIERDEFLWVVVFDKDRDNYGTGWVAYSRNKRTNVCDTYNTFFIDKSILRGTVIGSIHTPELLRQKV